MDTTTPARLTAADVPPVQVAEARGWLADCDFPVPADAADVLLAVDGAYEGGLRAFLRDTLPLLDVAPAAMEPHIDPRWARVFGHRPRAAVAGVRPAPEGPATFTSTPWSSR